MNTNKPSVNELLASEITNPAIIDEILNVDNDNLSNNLVECAKFIKENESKIDDLDEKIKLLIAEKKSLQDVNTNIRNKMLMVMNEKIWQKIDDPVHPIYLQKSKPSIVLNIKPENLPKEFQKTSIVADKIALAKAIKEGAEINGVTLVQSDVIKIG